MSRRIIALHRVVNAALFGAIIFLSFLPGLGWAWHRVLPEHEHWFVGAFHDDSRVDPDTTESSECLDCAPLPNGAPIMHSPIFTAFQIVALAAGLPSGFYIALPPSITECVLPESSIPSFLFLPLFDPPPKTV